MSVNQIRTSMLTLIYHKKLESLLIVIVTVRSQLKAELKKTQLLDHVPKLLVLLFVSVCMDTWMTRSAIDVPFSDEWQGTPN